MHLKDEGFSLMEVMFSVGLVAILLIGIMTTITAFASYTKRDFIRTCLIQAAASGIEAKRSNYSLNSLNVPCGGIIVNVTITGTPPANPPDPGLGVTACATVIATSTYGGRSLSIRDRVCNFSD